MIKWIAMFLMIVDHIGYYLGFLMPEPVVLVLRLIGRLSFPIFAYSVALGFLRTKNRTRYFMRMFLFAFITQAALAVTAYFTGIGVFINVMFTFSLAILFMASTELLEKTRDVLRINESKHTNEGKNTSSRRVELAGHTIPAALGIVIAVFSMILILGVTAWFDPDYNLFGVLSVFLFYIIQKKVRKPELALMNDQHALLVMIVSFLGLNLAWALFEINFSAQPTYWILMEIFSVCSIGILLLDMPRKKPAALEKYFFYFFYPAHLVLLMIISYFLAAGR